jgi:hypothetical protein
MQALADQAAAVIAEQSLVVREHLDKDLRVVMVLLRHII